jgi:hypothetical protein
MSCAPSRPPWLRDWRFVRPGVGREFQRSLFAVFIS